MPTDTTDRNRTRLRAIACLFGFGVIASGIAVVTLLFPGTFLDQLWAVNPEGHEGMQRLGPLAIALMAAVCATCATIAIGLWKERRWGTTLAIAGLGINLVSDVLTAVVRHQLITLIGVPIAGGLMVYLVRTRRVSSTAQGPRAPGARR